MIRIVKELERGTLMAKTDIEIDFRLMPIHPRDHDWLGFTLQNEMQDSEFYYDTALLQGLTVSCSYFEKFSTTLHWIMETEFGAQVSHIIDDFFLCWTKKFPTLQVINGYVSKSVQTHWHSNKTRQNSLAYYQYHYLSY